ncbi:Arm DNA-binding domain-containing protein [Bradyrhizobium viridifuturi]|uniref:Arm DNA-binding domain-containing protein n=1 Tax=Bradyrhizobium viridifuturi TaxID=1654716 RepID=UPI00067E8C9E|nr:Arm DNA-binding domain-containing protein [Bradyrhizobium viridifuturi]
MTDPDNPSPSKVRDRSKDKKRSRLFTDMSVRKLKLREGETAQVTYRDKKQPGLLLVLNVSGSKAWRVSFYHKALGKMRTRHLGYFRPGAPDHMALKTARDEAAKLKADRDNIPAKVEVATGPDTFEVVAERYLRKYVDGKLRTASQIRRMVEKVYPAWGTKPFESIRRSDIANLLDEIEETREKGPQTSRSQCCVG